MKQFLVPASESVPPSLVEKFIQFVEGVLGIVIPEGNRVLFLDCCLSGYVDGIRGWDGCECKHLQYRPIGCSVGGCPRCVERATRALAQYAFWRWRNLFELSNAEIAVDFVTFTLAGKFHKVVMGDVSLFQRVCVESLDEYYEVGVDEELFVSSVVQSWGDEDLSGEPSPHCHVVIAPWTFSKKTHSIVRKLSMVGEFISRNRLLQVFNRPLLEIFNRRMVEAFGLAKGTVVSLNVNRRFASQKLKGVVIAEGQLFHQLKYLYRQPVTDIVKAMLNWGFMKVVGGYMVRIGKNRVDGSSLVAELSTERKAQLIQLLRMSGLKDENEYRISKSVVKRYERVVSFGAASKRKVGLVLKQLAIDNKRSDFVYKAFSKWFREHTSCCWYHKDSHPLGVSEKVSRIEAVRKYGGRLLMHVTYLERKHGVVELENCDTSG